MSDQNPFEIQGEMSQVAACLEVFRALEPGGWVSLHDLHAQVRDLTKTPISFDSLKGAAWHAGERLPRNHELGIDWYMGGYKRHDSVALAHAAETRLDRAIKDLIRLGTRTKAALSQPDLPAPYRNRMEQLQVNSLRQAALSERRKNRFRPQLPPGEGA